MSNTNSGTDAKPLECSSCGGAGHDDTISGLDEGCETCGTCRGTGVERCAICDAPAVMRLAPPDAPDTFCATHGEDEPSEGVAA